MYGDNEEADRGRKEVSHEPSVEQRENSLPPLFTQHPAQPHLLSSLHLTLDPLCFPLLFRWPSTSLWLSLRPCQGILNKFSRSSSLPFSSLVLSHPYTDPRLYMPQGYSTKCVWACSSSTFVCARTYWQWPVAKLVSDRGEISLFSGRLTVGRNSKGD